ncbi:hypothetical protein QTP70_015748 [Hemibagrus guttatus]|uniref:Uncharacterized protein n=1 Tax=Hemibagrus guttatus TaxID=175788 RepID=A0AAE0UIV7_9TELE|nr:hypothetical protein QTP70_015748 [Hemibagrus guttatus]
MDQYFKEAWEGIDLGIAPTFNMMRSSLATYAKRQLGHKTYRKVATFMCCDEHTDKKLYQADDPAEAILWSRYLSVLAISTYAAKKRSKECKKAYGHNDNMETVSSSEEETEEELLELSGPEEPMVILPDSEEEMKQVPRKTYQLRKRNKIVQSKQQRSDSSEHDSEMEEDPVRQRVTKVVKKKSALSPIPQRQINRSKHMVSSSEDDGTDDWKPTQDSSEDDSEMEEGPVRQRVTKVVKKKRALSPIPQRQQAYTNPGKASVLKIHSSKMVFDGTSKEKTHIFNQSSLFEVTLPISGNKRHQVGSPSAQMVVSGSMRESGQGREAEIQDEALEKEGSEGEGQGGEATVQEEGLETG